MCMKPRTRKSLGKLLAVIGILAMLSFLLIPAFQ